MVETRHQRAAAEEKRKAVENKSMKTDVVEMKNNRAKRAGIPNLQICACIIIIAITYFTLPDSFRPTGEPTVKHVWYFGWISALSTAIGVIPAVIAPTHHSYWIGVSNAIAAGMMIAASYTLLIEGCFFSERDDSSEISGTIRTMIGVALGVGFILSTKSFLDKHVDLKVGNLAGADAQKVLLIIAVMTLHSLSEGVGIGVGFGGSNGSELGAFICASIAVHNIPEGLAVAIVLLPRNVSKLATALWCVMTSIPQPIMSVPAFLFVNYFIPILPVGFGFAGGAMAWVAVFELLVGAYEDTNAVTTVFFSSVALAVMMVLQQCIDEGSRN